MLLYWMPNQTCILLYITYTRLIHYYSFTDVQPEPLVNEAITAANFHEILPALASSFDSPTPQTADADDSIINHHDPLLGAISTKTPPSSTAVLPINNNPVCINCLYFQHYSISAFYIFIGV